ncbi:hypothetical protein VNO77_33297 [Canavalia gladiata]|uniref:Uncharacterized protein n=1 Tax=Canavalia gladiata TaxID=3824 RepID=A0AAN9KFC0_CANGL
MDITGWVAYVIHQKMKSLKEQIKDRNKIVLGNLPNKITKLNEEIRTIKLQIKEGDDSVSLHEKKLAKLGSLSKSVTQPDAMIHQKSKETVGLRDGAKSPSLDGYAYAFYKKFCHLLMEDIFLTFQKFHQYADDTPIINKVSNVNLWCLNLILISFEMVQNGREKVRPILWVKWKDVCKLKEMGGKVLISYGSLFVHDWKKDVEMVERSDVHHN